MKNKKQNKLKKGNKQNSDTIKFFNQLMNGKEKFIILSDGKRMICHHVGTAKFVFNTLKIATLNTLKQISKHC